MNVREILTKFTFSADTGKLEKIEGQLESIKQRIGFLAGVELAKGLFELGEKFATFAEQLHVAAESAGLSVESFQKLTFSAKQSAISTEEMETAMTRLSRALYNAKTGGAEAQKAFYLAGISQQQIQGWKTSQDALLGLADRFSQIKDPIQKSALATQLLGRGSIHMVGYLSQGSAAIRAQGAEAEKLGAVISGKDVGALVSLEHSLQKIFAIFQAIGAKIAAYFAPIIEDVINRFIKLTSANKGLIELNVENFLKNVAFGLGFVVGIVEDLFTLVVKLATYFKSEGDILPIIAKIAGAAGGLLAVGAAFKFIGAAVSLLSSPILVVSTALAAIVSSIHDLYKMLFEGGRFEDTWLYKGAEKLGLGGAVNSVIDKVSDFGANIISGGKYSAGDSNITNNIVVNAHTGASPNEIGQAVKDHLSGHIDGLLRGAEAGTAAGIVR